MLELAFSRRICCSRVCIAIRNAGLPLVSIETPIIRPGIDRLYLSLLAKNAAWGPPKPKGTPKRWLEPNTTSAPNWPGDCSNTKLIMSAPTATRAFCSWAASMMLFKSQMEPSLPGYCTITPNTSCWARSFAGSPVTISNPKYSARVRITERFCGWVFSSTKKVTLFFLLARLHKAMASAAAVASSNKDALESSIPVRSIIICW